MWYYKFAVAKAFHFYCRVGIAFLIITLCKAGSQIIASPYASKTQALYIKEQTASVFHCPAMYYCLYAMPVNDAMSFLFITQLHQVASFTVIAFVTFVLFRLEHKVSAQKI